MNKLLSANFLRLRKNTCFWGCVIYMIVVAVIYPIIRYVGMKHTGYITYLEGGFSVYAIFVPILLAIFYSLFVGREYSDGTIRNKIMIGHKRLDIYLSNLITNAIVMFLLCTIFLIVYLCVGIPLLGFFKSDVSYVLQIVCLAYILCLAFTCIYTAVSMISSSKAISSIVCMMSVFILIMIGIYINARLEEPKMYPAYNVLQDGEMEEKEELNPNYLEGAKRDVYAFLNDFLPGDQVVQCASMQIEKPVVLMIYSGMICIITSGIGIYLFKQKDLK